MPFCTWLILSKRAVNGSVSSTENRICTPVCVTRSSCRMSLKLRSAFSAGVSLRRMTSSCSMLQAPTMRLFVQVRPSAEAIRHLRAHLDGLRTSNPDHWHVTLAFLAEADSPDPLYDGLAAAASLHEPFRLSLRGGGS